MNNSKSLLIGEYRILNITIWIICSYWLASTVKNVLFEPTVPENFTDFVFVIFRNKVFYLAAILILLRWGHERLNDLGLSATSIFRQFIFGLTFGIIIWSLIHLLLNPALATLDLPKGTTGFSIVSQLTSVSALLVWYCLGIFGGGVVEEVQRVFVLTRFEKWKGLNALYAALLVSSVVFGVAHLYQGVSSAISAGASGLLFGFVYLRKRMLIEAMTAHAVYDIISITIAYMMATN
jgi:membrane protease YdiL (CAAX protease family)